MTEPERPQPLVAPVASAAVGLLGAWLVTRNINLTPDQALQLGVLLTGGINVGAKLIARRYNPQNVAKPDVVALPPCPICGGAHAPETHPPEQQARRADDRVARRAAVTFPKVTPNDAQRALVAALLADLEARGVLAPKPARPAVRRQTRKRIIAPDAPPDRVPIPLVEGVERVDRVERGARGDRSPRDGAS
jgi:hypothetical protein